MSDAARFTEDNAWVPPETYRDTVEAAETTAAMLIAKMQGQLVVPVSEVEFLARRLFTLVALAHRSLPPDVG